MDTTTERRTVKATVAYRLSDAGRREALRLGLDAREAQTLTGEVDLETYLPIVAIDGVGSASVAVGSVYGEYRDVPETWEVYGVARVAAKLAEHHERIAREKSERADAVAAYLAGAEVEWRGDSVYEALTTEQRATVDATRDGRRALMAARRKAEQDAWIESFLADSDARAEREYYGVGPKSTIKDERMIPRAHPRHAEIDAEAERRDKADSARVAETARARRVAKLGYLRNWILTQGTEDMRERLTAPTSLAGLDEQDRERVEHLGLVPEREAIDAVREALFAPLAGEALYQRVSASELDGAPDDAIDDEDGYDAYGGYRHRKDDMSCSSEVETEVTSAQWERVKAIRANAPQGAAIELRRHECECTTDRCAWGRSNHSVVRHGILVTVTATEGLDLHREYAC